MAACRQSRPISTTPISRRVRLAGSPTSARSRGALPAIRRTSTAPSRSSSTGIPPISFTSWYEANGGYYIPAAPNYTSLEVYTADPEAGPLSQSGQLRRNKGYAGPSDNKAALSYSKYIVIDTFAKAVQDGDAQGAIEWGADQLERIYGE